MNKSNNNSSTQNGWYKSFNTWLLILNLFLAIINFCLLCNNAPREKLGFDYMGVLVTSLGVLVTVLVALNIFNGVDVKRDISKCEKDIMELERNKMDKKQKVDN